MLGYKQCYTHNYAKFNRKKFGKILTLFQKNQPRPNKYLSKNEYEIYSILYQDCFKKGDIVD